ncbi:MAG: hypothetical protein SGI96_09245 [Bacteroidota bacterium]|nr:hypothetical protein [Bacteroidota bacterium]
MKLNFKLGVFALLAMAVSCKKNSDVNDNQSNNIYKDWLAKNNSQVLKENLELTNFGNAAGTGKVKLNWDKQKTSFRNGYSYVKVPYVTTDGEKSDYSIVFRVKNNKIEGAKIKYTTFIASDSEVVAVEQWLDGNGAISEMWAFKNNKYFKATDYTFLETASRSSSCESFLTITNVPYNYWIGDMLYVSMRRKYSWVSICNYNEEETQSELDPADYGGGGGGEPDPNADTITEELDKDCLKNLFKLILETRNLGGSLIMEDIKEALGDNNPVIFNWNNAALGTANSNQYSNSASNGNSGYNITLNTSLLGTASTEFISAVILTSYFQAFTVAYGNAWANNQGDINDALNAIANSLRQLHPSLPTGAQYAITLKAFYDGNGPLFNQSQLAIRLNSYYSGLINNGKIPMTNGQVESDYDGWQVAKDNVGAKYGTNATSGSPSLCQ